MTLTTSSLRDVKHYECDYVDDDDDADDDDRLQKPHSYGMF